MKEAIMLKYGEMALKGANRNSFEDILIKNIRYKVDGLGKAEILKAQSTVYLLPESEDYDFDEVVWRLKKLFGIAVLCRAAELPKDFTVITERGSEYVREALEGASTFKVEAKRSDKKFPLSSPEICARFGDILLTDYPHLQVDVVNPQVTVHVEIRDYAAYVYAGRISGAGGMPVGSSGRGMLLISGGIDSPVAGYMMSKRGLALEAVHFMSPPYTSERALYKVEQLLEKVADYAGRIRFHRVNFTEIQENIRDKCSEEFMTIIMRRFMMDIADRIAEREDCGALITGESLGQVASQTIMALSCTEDAATKPVLRPLIGMDKNEIIEIARKIDTFETSIEPFEDCCTIFTPKHPKTKPKLDLVLEEENKLDRESLIEHAMSGITVSMIRPAFQK